MGRIVRILVTLGLVAVVIVVIRRLMGGAGNPPPSTTPWEPVTPESPLATTTPPTAAGSAPTDGSGATGAPVADRKPAGGGGAAGDEVTGWVEPEADGSCPAGFPVKAKLSSKIFHVPGGGSYERTSADRCYADPAAAEADGLRQAKR